MKVTAEGIESETMHQWLADYECDYMQGFYFGYPMSLSEISPWLHASNHKRRVMRKIIIASQNPAKVNAVRSAFSTVFPDQEWELLAYQYRAKSPISP